MLIKGAIGDPPAIKGDVDMLRNAFPGVKGVC